MKNRLGLGVLLFSCIFLVGVQLFARSKSSAEQNSNFVVVLIKPYQAMVQELLGPDFQVYSILDDGQEPHDLELRPQSTRNIKKSKYYLFMGFPNEEKYILPFLDPKTKITDLTKDIELIKEGESEFANNLHYWLSPAVLKIQVLQLEKDLCMTDACSERATKIITRLTGLQRAIKRELSKLESRSVIVYHPFLGYYAKEFDLEEISIEQEGRESTIKEFQDTLARINASGETTILVQKEFSQKEALVLANKINGRLDEVNIFSEEWDKELLYLSEVIANK